MEDKQEMTPEKALQTLRGIDPSRIYSYAHEVFLYRSGEIENDHKFRIIGDYVNLTKDHVTLEDALAEAVAKLKAEL